MKSFRDKSPAVLLCCWVTFVAMLGLAVGADEYKPDPNYKPTRDLTQFFAKVRAGRPVTVMGIGGSVTEGHSWAAMAAEWLQKQYPKTHIHYVDGAYGGTGPDAVIFRFRRDILMHHPDLVFIEYTVNSYAKHDINFKALDGMVLQLLRQWQKPDIVFVYVGDDKGKRDLSKVQPLARHYGFQEVDPRKHLQTLIDAGKVQWKDIARDGIHPNEKGHAIYSEPLIELLKQQAALTGSPTSEPPVPPPYSSDEWARAALAPIATAHYGKEWKAVNPSPWGTRFWEEMIETDQVGAIVDLHGQQHDARRVPARSQGLRQHRLVDRRRKRDRGHAGKPGNTPGWHVGAATSSSPATCPPASTRSRSPSSPSGKRPSVILSASAVSA